MIINLKNEKNIDILILERSTTKELLITAKPENSNELSSTILLLSNIIQNYNAQIIKMDVFGANAAYTDCLDTIKEKFKSVNWPITYIENSQTESHGISGIYAHAITGVNVKTLSLNGLAIGREFTDNNARYCFLGNIHSNNIKVSPKDQTLEVLTNLENGLKLAEMNLTDLFRTWFFNNKILDWYDDFNTTRTPFYEERSIFDGLLPASTGIGGNNPIGSALIAGGIAMQVKNDKITVKEVPSPLQCSANDYGSSFSRAVEISQPDHRRLFISGTASIDPIGKTIHIGNTKDQVSQTLDIVGAILKSRGMTYSDVTRAYAYYKPNVEVDTQLLEKFGLPLQRVIIVHNDVCRDDLLFEIELDAISTKLI
jgi:enamine deaminase RidA (YjgF/YER057c/UK114 family)